MTVMNFEDRRPLAQQRRAREMRWVFADLASRLPDGVMLAICKAVKANSEKPLTTLPTKYRQRALDAFRVSKQARGEVVTLPAAR